MISEPYQWSWHRFAELDAKGLYDVIALREQIFIVEQKCAYQDADGLDPRAEHLRCFLGDELVAYARVFAAGVIKASAAIGRLVVAQEHRGRDLGSEAMTRALQHLVESHESALRVEISAQQHLQGFYQRLGFVPFGPGYLEDGIPHVGMSIKT